MVPPGLALQREASAVYLPALDAWAITRYHDVRAVLADPVTFPSAGPGARNGHLDPEAAAAYPLDGALHTYALIDTDRPLQTRLRRPMAKVFTPHRVRDLEVALGGDVEDLLDRLFADGDRAADLVAGFTRQLPVRAICRVFGLPLSLSPRIQDWAEAVIALATPGLPVPEQVRAAQAFADLDQYLRRVIGSGPDDLRDGLIRDLVVARAAGEHDLSDDELVGNIGNVLFAGHETTASTLTNVIARLLTERQLWTALADRSLEPAELLEEVLRVETSVIGLHRWTRGHVRIGDSDVPSGARLWVAFGAANRDPGVFPEPGRIDPNRRRTDNPLTFGHGIHFCVGAALARTQLRLALAHLPRRFPRLTLTGSWSELPFHLLRVIPALNANAEVTGAGSR